MTFTKRKNIYFSGNRDKFEKEWNKVTFHLTAVHQNSKGHREARTASYNNMLLDTQLKEKEQ